VSKVSSPFGCSLLKHLLCPLSQPPNTTTAAALLSSTVTMQMGIERVLKENFSNLGQVIQVNDGGVEKPSELTMDMVMIEINRIGPAISAMGGNYELVHVDPIGVVEVKFKGPNKLQQGLELALLDIPLCKHVKFTMFDE